jgi:mRNA interferase MazF
VVTEPARGEVWWGEIADVGRRPYLVLTRDIVIPVLRRVVVAPVTKTIREIPSELLLGREEGLDVECVASMDNVLTLSKSILVQRIGALGSERIHELCEALSAAVDC